MQLYTIMAYKKNKLLKRDKLIEIFIYLFIYYYYVFLAESA